MSGYKKNYIKFVHKQLLSTKFTTKKSYGSVYSRPTTEAKTTSDRSSGLRLGRLGSYNSAHYCDPTHSKDTEKYSGTTLTARLKETEKKEVTQPPVSYRSIAKPNARSRDPSMERDTTERLASLSIHNCNTLYPPSVHTRSASHDRSETTTSTSTIPKYTGRSSITKSDKFGLTRTSKEDLSATKYKPLSKTTSREDLDSGPKKYITSRFLPKNTIEKSHTAYIRPNSTRISSTQRDTSRKNREILNLLSAQTETNKTSRSTSRSSNISEPTSSATEKTSTTSTTTSTGVSKSDKVKSDNISDSTKSKVSNVSATPWSSYLDLKFSSPKSSKNSANSSQSQSKQSISNTKTSTSNLTKTSSQSESKLKSNKSASHNSGRSILNKDFRKSVLNMNPEIKKCHHNGSVSPVESEAEFPLSEATDVSENLSSCVSYHKQSSSSASKLPKRSNAENSDRRSVRSNTRSPSIPSEGQNSTTATSGSEDDLKTKSTTSKSDLKQTKSFLSSRSSLLNEHGDGSEKSPKPPMSPRAKAEKSEAEAKTLLMRTLTPVSGIFKIKHQDSDHRINWMDSTDKETSSTSSKISKSTKDETKSENIPKIKIMRRVDSGERAWWLDDNATPPEGIQIYQENNPDNSQEQESQKDYFQKYRIRHIDSGEKAWWLSSNENISECTKSNNEPKYKISRQLSGEKAWWLKTPPKSNAHSSETSESDLEDTHDLPLGDRASPEGLEMPREEEEQLFYSKTKKPNSLFISKHKNIDDILGGTSQLLSPLMEQIFNYQERKHSVEECLEVQPNQVKIHDSTAQHGIIHPNRLDNVGVVSSSSSQADRIYKAGFLAALEQKTD
ncbi:hypothetical protein RN001_009853 [Aquatica leii]|uniref:Uncharacterized protein n=1 Tax=Aquatica leii TaxID=1421715 RepID=A0AAN7P5R8_9COLE|nr:hypothetical protein RN001_009853 [Aquatica leii]